MQTPKKLIAFFLFMSLFSIIRSAGPGDTASSAMVKTSYGMPGFLKSRSWGSTHILPLLTTAATCAYLNQTLLNTEAEFWAIFSRHAFAEALTRSLKGFNFQLQSQKPLTTTVQNISSLVIKMFVLYGIGLGFVRLEDYVFTQAHIGFWDAFVLAMLYTAAEHFTDEKHEFRTEWQHELKHVLYDPKHAAEITSKVIATQLTRPELFAGQMYDEQVAKDLATIQKSPELLQQMQLNYEAQQALAMRMVTGQTVNPVGMLEDGTGASGSGSGDKKGKQTTERPADIATDIVPRSKSAGAGRAHQQAEVICALSPELKQAFEESTEYLLKLFGIVPFWEEARCTFTQEFQEKLERNIVLFKNLLTNKPAGLIAAEKEKSDFAQEELEALEKSRKFLRMLVGKAHTNYRLRGLQDECQALLHRELPGLFHDKFPGLLRQELPEQFLEQFKKRVKQEALLIYEQMKEQQQKEIADLATKIAINQQTGITFAKNAKQKALEDRNCLRRTADALDTCCCGCCPEKTAEIKPPRGAMVGVVLVPKEEPKDDGADTVPADDEEQGRACGGRCPSWCPSKPKKNKSRVAPTKNESDATAALLDKKGKQKEEKTEEEGGLKKQDADPSQAAAEGNVDRNVTDSAAAEQVDVTASPNSQGGSPGHGGGSQSQSARRASAARRVALHRGPGAAAGYKPPVDPSSPPTPTSTKSTDPLVGRSGGAFHGVDGNSDGEEAGTEVA